MSLKGKKVGFAFTGSFCTFDKTMRELERLVKEGAIVYPIFSFNAQSIDTRFGIAQEFVQKASELTGNDAILTIKDAEPIGPRSLFDVMIIAPCTGNTLSKLANGITDTPVLMAAKAHLRTLKPLVLAIATNDALGMSFKNIGLLTNTTNIYMVPFGQDDYTKKPNSLVAHTEFILPTLEQALDRTQIQPVIRSPF